MAKPDFDIEAHLQELRKQRVERAPHHFPPMGSSERLDYEALTVENCLRMVPVFQDDESPFLDGRYRSAAAAHENAKFVADMVYEPKRGGCDFLIKLKNSEQVVGVLHLFDYSIEHFSDAPQRCSIGYAIGANFRRQFFATEAVRHLMDYAYRNHQKRKFLAYTAVENEPSNRFLVSMGFRLANEDYYCGRDGGVNFYVFEMPEN